MRHRNSGRSLNRTSSHRKAMFSNMCNSLIEHELIKTTLPKAKELRRYIEPLITRSKSDSVASRRQAFSVLRSKSSVGKLFTQLGPRFQDRPGGYVRIIKCGFRTGDNAPMAIIEFVDRSEPTKGDEKKTKAKSKAKSQGKAESKKETKAASVSTEAKEESKTVAKTEVKKAKSPEAKTQKKVDTKKEASKDANQPEPNSTSDQAKNAKKDSKN